MIDPTKLRSLVADQLSTELYVDGSAIGVGLFTPDGRQLGVRVRETAAGLLLSDAGETWSDLVKDGYVDSRPTTAIREKIEEACRGYGVAWESTTRSLQTTCDEQGLAGAMLRMVGASIAIDGWRSWMRARQHGRPHVQTIMRAVETQAIKSGWDYLPKFQVAGGTRLWHSAGRFSRNRQQAVFTFINEEDPEQAAERVAGWILDTQVPLVFVVPANVAMTLRADEILVKAVDRAEIVDRSDSETARRIVEAAERVASVG